MLAEEIAEEIHGDALSHLTKHPSNGFVHEVMRMVVVYFSIA